MNVKFLLILSLTIILCWKNVNCGAFADFFCWTFRADLPGADWCYGDEGKTTLTKSVVSKSLQSLIFFFGIFRRERQKLSSRKN